MQIDPSQSEVFFKMVMDAVHSSNWKMVAALGVVFVVYAARKWGAAKIPFLASDRGGAMLALATGVSGAIVTGLGAGKVSGAAMLDGVITGVMAAGGYSLVKKIMWPSPLIDK